MSTPAAKLATDVAELRRQVTALTRAGQISRSTVAIGDQDLSVPAVLADGYAAWQAVPGLEEKIVEATAAVEAATRELDERLADLTDGLEGADDRLAEAQARVDAAFGEISTVRDLADGAWTRAEGAASTATGAAKTASDAAATASGAASTASSAASTATSAAKTAADSKTAAEAAQRAADALKAEAAAATTAAEAAQTTADGATSAALAAAGLAAGKGRTWVQSAQPPAGVVYAWTGVVNESPSTRTEDGAVRTNLIADPHALGTRFWVTPGGVPSTTADGFTLAPSGTSTAYTYAAPHSSVLSPSKNRFAIKAGQSVALGSTVTNRSAASVWVRLGTAFYDDAGGGGAANSILGPVEELKPGETRRFELQGTLSPLSARATGTLPLVYVYGTAGSGGAPSSAVTASRDWHFEIADTPFTAAPPFFSGASDSDRDLDLWIDTTADANTPKRHRGGTWAVVTDRVATAAAGAAAEATRKATDATDLARAAQATADGRPLLLSGTSSPTGTSPRAPQGSTYFRVNGAGEIVAQWQQTAAGTASTWTPRQLTSDAIANLDVGKLRATTAEIADAVVRQLAAQSASIQRVDAKNLFVTGTASLSEAVVERLFAEVVKAKTVTATEAFIGKDALLDGSVTARTMAADAFQGKTFEGVSFTGGTFRSAAAGQRVEIAKTMINFFDETGKRSGQVLARGGRVILGDDKGSAITIGDTDAEGLRSDLYTPRLRADRATIGTTKLSPTFVQLGGDALGTTGEFYGDDEVAIRTRAASIGRVFTEELRDSRKRDGENLLDRLADTGWIALPASALAAGWTVRPGFPLRYRVKGGVAYLSGQVYTGPGVSAPTLARVAVTLPAVARPPLTTFVAGVIPWGHFTEVNPDGTVAITANRVRTASTGFALDGVSYLVD